MKFVKKIKTLVLNCGIIQACVKVEVKVWTLNRGCSKIMYWTTEGLKEDPVAKKFDMLKLS